MRPLNVCINRIMCGLPCTSEELEAIAAHIEAQKRSRNIFVTTVIVVLFASIITLAFLAEV